MPKTFSDAIGDARRTLRMTQDEFARLVETSVRSVRRWEAGHAEPALRDIPRIVDGLRSKNAALADAVAVALGMQGLTQSSAPTVDRTALADAIRAELFDAAEVLDLSPRRIREALTRVIDLAVERGATVAQVQAALRQLGKVKK